MENPIKMDDLEVPPFQEASTYTYTIFPFCPPVSTFFHLVGAIEKTTAGKRAGNAGFCTHPGSILLDFWHRNAMGEGVINRWI